MAASVTYGYPPPTPLPLFFLILPWGVSTLQLISPGGCYTPTYQKGHLTFVHGYNGKQGHLKRSAVETARKGVPVSPTERSEPDELGHATVGREVAGSSPGKKVPASICQNIFRLQECADVHIPAGNPRGAIQLH